MNLTSKAPQFTVILPVRNGGNYLHLCVASILTQSYQNFELVILENKSADGTAEWLKTLESKDDRVRVIPAESYLTIEQNWRRIVSLPKNEFITIIGHDDLLEADFLQEINLLIQQEPDASLYLTHFKLIDHKGDLLRYCRPIPKYESAADFLAARMADIRDSFGTGYVMRSKLYEMVGGIPAYRNLLYADDALWLELMGNSYKVTSSKSCFSYRIHAGSTSGRPDQAALFEGLKSYLELLRHLSSKYPEVRVVMDRYGEQYVATRCQNYYYHLIDSAKFGRAVAPELSAEVAGIMNEFAENVSLDKSTKLQRLALAIRYRFVIWLRKFLM